MAKPKTSWSKVSKWYNSHLADKNNYHNQVVYPRLSAMLQSSLPAKSKPASVTLLDVGCGQGGWIEYLHNQAFAGKWRFVGTDISGALIKIAQEKRLPRAKFEVAAAEALDTSLPPQEKFDLITCVLALQNMEDLGPVFAQVNKLLASQGEFLFVITHPAFRIPKHSDWVDDPRLGKIYRGSEKYMSHLKLPIKSRPFKSEFGQAHNEITWSFHRPLQDYVNTLSSNSLAVVGMEEWVSHKKTEAANPKAKLEDTARQEIPMFMCVRTRKIA